MSAGKDADQVRSVFARGGGASRDFCIISYSLIGKMAEELQAANFKFVVSR